MIVAIDGPAGAGKSTVARKLAERLGFRYLDTGAMYRALTWLAMREGMPLGEGEPLGELARLNPVTFDEEGRVFIAGVDVTSLIRQSRIDRMVPVVARHHAVREVMRERQRELAEQRNAVIEGRDIGTVVAPDAEVKVYLAGRPGDSRRPATSGASRHRGRRARDRPAHPRRVGPRPDAACCGCRADRHDEPRGRRRRRADRGARPRPHRRDAMSGPDIAWAIGRRTMGWPARLVARIRTYGRDRVPATGGLVYAVNHMHWIDIPLLGVVSPRNIDFVAKVEARRVPGPRALPRVARHDRGAARRVRPRRRAPDAQSARDGRVVGLFVEGTRNTAGRPGTAQPGAAMVAMQEERAGDPDRDLRHAVLEASATSRPCSVAFGEPVAFDGLPKNGRGYKEATVEIERRINVLFDWLADVHAKGRPKGVEPPV